MNPEEPQGRPATTADPDSAEPRVVVLVDPEFSASPGQSDPELHQIVGGWPVQPDGGTGRFRANPHYRPSQPGSPLDPLDAVLQAMALGRSSLADLLSVLRETELGVALEADGGAVVAPAPDGVASVVVASSPGRRDGIDVPGWREVSVAELAAALPAQGVDVLINPGAPASTRLLADIIRDAAAPPTDDDEPVPSPS